MKLAGSWRAVALLFDSDVNMCLAADSSESGALFRDGRGENKGLWLIMTRGTRQMTSTESALLSLEGLSVGDAFGHTLGEGNTSPLDCATFKP